MIAVAVASAARTMRRRVTETGSFRLVCHLQVSFRKEVPLSGLSEALRGFVSHSCVLRGSYSRGLKPPLHVLQPPANRPDVWVTFRPMPKRVLRALDLWRSKLAATLFKPCLSAAC